ncbi:MAG: hypothetical protein ACOCP8_06770 [archaeon]
MDKVFEIAERTFNRLTLDEVVNFIKYPLLILWSCVPLSLWGYISTENYLLFKTFYWLIIINVFLSGLSYLYISKTKKEELKEGLESLKEFIDYILNTLNKKREGLLKQENGINLKKEKNNGNND